MALPAPACCTPSSRAQSGTVGPFSSRVEPLATNTSALIWPVKYQVRYLHATRAALRFMDCVNRAEVSVPVCCKLIRVLEQLEFQH